MKKKYVYITLLLIILFGAYLRFYALAYPPLWIDEAASVDMAINSKSGFAETSGGHYATAQFLHHIMGFFIDFKKSEFSARFPSVIFGLLTIILSFFIGREYSLKAGMIAALFVSVFYLEVLFSRQARYYQLFQLMFYSSIYFLYKAKEKPLYLYLALIALLITIDTHIKGIALCFLFLFYFVYHHNSKKLLILTLSIFSLFFFSFLSVLSRYESLTNISINYTREYLVYFNNIGYLLVLAFIGVFLAYTKYKKASILTDFILISSLVTLLGILTLDVFGFRYIYFIFLPLLIFAAILMAYTIETYGKFMYISLILIIIIPSNLIYPANYSNIILPIQYQLNDPSTPHTNYKIVPENLIEDMRDKTLVSYYSSDIMFYIKKPEYVLKHTLDGRIPDQVSFIDEKGILRDKYSGALIHNSCIKRPYYVNVDTFSYVKLNDKQRELHRHIINDCIIKYDRFDLKIYFCK